MAWVLPAELNIDTLPPAPTLTTTRLATVLLGVKFRLAANGRELPAGKMVMKPLAVGWVTVTLTATADTPDSGTPPCPVICTSTVAPGPTGPGPLRVSRMRAGVRGV